MSRAVLPVPLRALPLALLAAACAGEPATPGGAPAVARAAGDAEGVGREAAAAPAQATTASATEAEGAEGFLTDDNLRTVQLFFPSQEGWSLLPEDRIIFRTGTLTSQVKQAVSELLLGPQDEGGDGLAAFPSRTRLLAVFLLGDGTAVIDLGREARAVLPGSAAELAAIYALVDTVVFNFPGVERVRILVEGQEIPTLAGHVDLTRPLAADLRWVDWGVAGPPPERAGAETPWNRWSSDIPRGVEEDDSAAPQRGSSIGPV